MPIPDVLRALLTAPAPSGREGTAARVWREAAQGFASSVAGDVIGSSVATVDGKGGGPMLAIVGHIDEIGLIVNHIDDDGMLWFSGVGGWDPQILVGQRVEVQGDAGPVAGIVGKKPIHLLRDEERKKVAELRDLHVDIGARDGDDARTRVRIGDVAVIAGEPVELPNGRLVSRALDNRLGAWVALEAARLVAEAGGAPGAVAAVASAQEETTGAGAQTTAFSLRPGVAVAVDVTHATDAPGVAPGELGSHGLGSGPVITRGAIVSRPLNDLLDAAAEAAGIECTTEASGGVTHTDADVVHISRAGVPTAVVSIPLRYMHSSVEMVELADVEAVIALIAGMALRLETDQALTRW